MKIFVIACSISFILFLILLAGSERRCRSSLSTVKGPDNRERDDVFNDVVGSYRFRDILTANEREFFGRIVRALPDHYVFCQVAFSALMEQVATGRQGKFDFYRIAQKRADYVVCDRNLSVVAVVELDDSSHSREKDRMRDAMLAGVGIRTVRFDSADRPSESKIRVIVLRESGCGGVDDK